MAVLADIKSKVWCISVLGTGVIAEGISSLRQCISIILHTSLGSDPLRPLFGSNVYKYQDAPVNIAIPNIKASIIEALATWEKRIKVLSVTHRMAATGHLEFEITYLLVDENLVDSIVYNPGGITGILTPVNLLLQAVFPPNIFVVRNFISFSLNNTAVQPPPPSGGFATPTDTYNWCVTNWGNYGTWQLLADRIILNLNPGNYTQASLAILVLQSGGTLVRFACFIPVLVARGTSYNASFNADNAGLDDTATHYVDDIITKEQLLDAVQALWGSHGTWAIEYVNDTTGEFNDDFGSDFDSQSTGYQLVLYSNTVTTALLQVEII